MSASSSSDADPALAQPRLMGERVLFLGRLAGMTRQEANVLVREHGGSLAGNEDLPATVVVLGDNQPDLASAIQADKASHQRLAQDVAEGCTQLLRESEFWERLGLVDEDSPDARSVQRLYTPAMLAELLSVPVAAIRRWHRNGSLVECRRVRRLPYFDFAEVAVARHLAALLAAGCSLAVIDRKLRELHRSMPEVARPLSDPTIVVSGRQLILRRGDDLTEPGGQLLIDFDKPTEFDDQVDVFLSVDQAYQDEGFRDPDEYEADADETLSTLDQLHLEALKWEDQVELEQAAEVYRTLLMAAGPRAEVHFALADLLYRRGDLAGARERFYAAIELDEEYVEARANLGCVLAESGELELAVAAFQGALAFHSDYADVHYHLANALQRLQRLGEAELHWQTFLALAPESPWADLARDSLSSVQSEQGHSDAH
ncbi:MAG: tetratricopeptide repeat protein [Bythopirellula sp.]